MHRPQQRRRPNRSSLQRGLCLSRRGRTASPWRGPGFRSRRYCLRSRNSVLVGGITVVAGANEGKYSPKIIRILDHQTHGRHRARRGNEALAGVTPLLQLEAAQGDETKQRVIVSAVYPVAGGQRRAHVAAGVAAVTATARITAEQSCPLSHYARLRILVGVVKTALRRAV